jgi:putative nucleotidyltransferase with HDIG domain
VRRPPTNERIDALPPAPTTDALEGPRADLARAIPRRPRVSWWLGISLATIFAILVVPAISADRWLGAMDVGKIVRGQPAPLTVRVPPFAGYDTATGHTGGGGVLIAKGEIANRDIAEDASELQNAQPNGAIPYLAFLLLVGVLAGLFTHHTRRSTHGRLLRVQLVSLGLIVATAIVVKLVMLSTALSVLVVPVALFAMVPTLVLDRVVGLATGTLAALVVAFLVPFDVGVAVMLMVQAGAAGLMIAERPKRRVRAIVIAGAVATVFTAATYPLMLYLSAGRLPLAELADPLHSAWLASALGPALATALTIVFVPLYQLAVGEITQGKLIELEDKQQPLLRQIADRAPGTWQHSLSMANLAESAANAIGANARLVKVGAFYHDLGKSLNPKYFIENLEPGETSPHDMLPPEVSCDAIFKHVTEGIVAARREGLHERIIDFMHMHHGNGVLEYFWAKCREQGNPKKLTVEHFRYPGVPPQSRETAILSICDAVEAAARTLKKPETSAIDNLVQRIVYGKLHVGQLDESGLSMADLRRINESLRETIRHANHTRVEYPWQKAQQDASASHHGDPDKLTQTGPRLDSLDRPARPESVAAPAARAPVEAYAQTDSAGATPKLRPQPADSSELAMRTTAPVARPDASGAGRTRPNVSTPRDAAVAGAWRPRVSDPSGSASWPERSESTNPGADLSGDVPMIIPAGPMPTDNDLTRPAPLQDFDATVPAPKLDPSEIIELRSSKPKLGEPAKPNLRDLAAKQATVVEPPPDESDPRMKRVTDPVGERTPSPEAIEFVTDAKRALKEASKDMVALPRTDSGSHPVPESAIVSEAIDRSPSMEIKVSGNEDVDSIGDVIEPPPPSLPRKRAATLPPLRPPTAPPVAGNRLPEPPNLTAPPPGVLRPPAAMPGVAPPSVTAPPPSTVRPPGMNYLDDMITLRPQYQPQSDLVVEKSEDGSMLIEPRKDDAASTQPTMSRDAIVTEEDAANSDAVITQPRMASIGDKTDPSVKLPEPEGAKLGQPSAWAQSLAARLDAAMDDDFGTETPIVAPTKAELQALLREPPDPTRKQSIDEIERLHHEALERSARSSQELDFDRRRPFPTVEVDEDAIESAIEIAPPARRNAIGVAKKKQEE